jgi:DNA-directed RNA polymerase specialized sigma24 family protein
MPRRDGRRAVTTREWLESDRPRRVAGRVARQYGLEPPDRRDLLEDLRIALLERGLAARISPKWVNQVAGDKAVDLLRQRALMLRAIPGAAEGAETGIGSEANISDLDAASLPPKLGAFCEMRFQRGLSEGEIARRLGLSQTSVHWLEQCCRLFAARDRR